MKNAVVAVVVLGVVGAIGCKPNYPTGMKFEDADGQTHSFPEWKEKALPVLVSVVADTDSFSGRSFALLHSIAEQYPGARLEIVAFHLQAPDNAALQAMAQGKGYRFKLVSVPKNLGLGVDLVNTMGVKYAGDVAVIDRTGRIKKVIATKSLTQAELEEQVRAAVEGVAGKP